MNNKGFAVSGILYTILLIFLALLMMLLFNFEGKKNILDKMKNELYNETNSNLYTEYENGTPIYFNPETNNVCSVEAYNNNTNASKTGNKTGCMKWYIFNDSTINENVNMILDHNTTGTVRWSTTDTNNTNADAVNAQLNTDVTTWKSILNSRLITADEVAKITGADKEPYNFKGSTSTYDKYFYFASNTSTASTACKSGNITGCKHRWLYDRINTSCTAYGCLNNADSGMIGVGYYTNTPIFGVTSHAWAVGTGGSLSNCNVKDSNLCGVRPVITVSKDILTSDICDVNLNQVYPFNYTGNEQEFTIPCNGNYKLETWGAQGGSVDTTYYGGYGGYSTGTIKLNKDTILYINSGGNGLCGYAGGGSTSPVAEGGYNGGGYALSYTMNTTTSNKDCSGGGATHIATVSGQLSNLSDHKGTYNEDLKTYVTDKIILVSGGGGGALHIYNGTYFYATGGSGGGNTGGLFKLISDNGYSSTIKAYKTSTQTTAGTHSWNGSVHQGSFGLGSDSGGGGGWYGGAGAYSSGGSGYIGNTSLTNKVMYCYNCTESLDEATRTISTTNISATPTSNYAKQGNGYAKITYLGN